MATETTKLTFVEGAAAATPAASRTVIYSKADGLMYSKDDAGVETLMSAGSAGMTNPMTTTGDMIYSSSGTTPARLAAVAAGRVITSAGTSTAPAWALPPGYEFDYVQITSPVTVTGTSIGATTTVVTGNAVTYDGSTIIEVEFFAPAAGPDPTVVGRDMRIFLFDGASEIGMVVLMQTGVTQVAGDFNYVPIIGKKRLTPSAASHTYSIKAFRSGGDGVIQAGAGTTSLLVPAYIRIMKV